MKRVIKIITFILIISVVITSNCISAFALVIHDGDFSFEVNTTKKEAKIVGYSGNGGKVVLPDSYLDYPVTVIDRNAFSGNKTITEIEFSDLITTVEEYAFMNCTSLETVYIPENTVNFGDRAFANCTSLQSATVLSDIVSMPTNMFSSCSSLSDLTLSETIVDFGYGCFNGCSSLTDLSFLSDAVMLDSYSFSGTGAKMVTLSDKLLAIPDNAFTNCNALAYVKIPESVALIQPNAFDREKVTIHCYPDSYAHSFAEENNISYEFLGTYLRGDADGNGKLNISDVTLIQKILAGIKTDIDGTIARAGDVDGDKKLTIRDATFIQMYIAEIRVPFNIGEEIDE